MNSATKIRSALVFGASGLVGKALTSQLIQNQTFQSVHIVVRRKFELTHHKLIEHIVDFENLSDFNPEARITDVFICLGTTRRKAGSKANFRKVDFDYVVAAGNWAKNNGCHSLNFVSSIGANANSGNFYLKTKGEAENSLALLNVPNTNIVRPSVLLGKRNDRRPGEIFGRWIMHPNAFYLKGKLEKYKGIYCEQVARAMISFATGNREGVNFIENDVLIRF